MLAELKNILEKNAGKLSIRVTPKASANRIKIEEGQVRVYVTCIPEDGKANEEVIKLLAKQLKIPKSSLEIIQGHKSRDKVIRLI